MLISNRLRRQKHFCGNYYSYDQCFYVGAETTTFSLATIDNNNILITSVTVGVLVPVLMIIAILVTFVTFVLLIRNGKIQWYGKNYYMNDCVVNR